MPRQPAKAPISPRAPARGKKRELLEGRTGVARSTRCQRAICTQVDQPRPWPLAAQAMLELEAEQSACFAGKVRPWALQAVRIDVSYWSATGTHHLRNYKHGNDS